MYGWRIVEGMVMVAVVTAAMVMVAMYESQDCHGKIDYAIVMVLVSVK